MTDEAPPVHDFSRVDAFVAARRRTAFLHALWRPMLAGAAGAALIVGAVYVTLPKFSYREIEIPRVTLRDVTVPNITMRDVSVNNIIPKDVVIEIPRMVESRSPTPSPEARTPDERRFASTKDWSEAIIRGRILRPDRNGFVLMTDDGEQSFYPARIGADGKPELDSSAEDIVAPFIGDLARCNKLPVGTFECVALHGGEEVFIRQTPIGRRRAPEGPHALAETKTAHKGAQA